MFAEPADFDRDALVAALDTEWGLSVSSVRYEPVGFGTHHYVAVTANDTTWWVNVDEVDEKSWIASSRSEALHGLARSLETAVALRRAGLEFVHAPVERRTHGVVAPLGDRFAVSVFEYVVGHSNEFGEYASDEERRVVLSMLGHIHAATGVIARQLPRIDPLEVPDRESFFAALDELDLPWTDGPFAEPARDLLFANARALRAAFDHFDRLAESVSRHRNRWVVTHGEPHGSNILFTEDGRTLLIDWDTAAIAPPERDLWMVEPTGEDGWHAYTSSGGTSAVDETAMELYRLWWTLAEITGYTRTFRSRHRRDANTVAAWENFNTYISRV